MNGEVMEVKGFRVGPAEDVERAVRLELVTRDERTLVLNLSLPVVSRLTNDLIDVEFNERFPASGGRDRESG